MGIVFSIDEKGTYLSRALDQLRAESLRENGALIRVTDDALIAAVRLALMEMHSEGVPEAALYAMGSKRLGLAWLDILTASIEQC